MRCTESLLEPISARPETLFSGRFRGPLFALMVALLASCQGAGSARSTGATSPPSPSSAEPSIALEDATAAPSENWDNIGITWMPSASPPASTGSPAQASTRAPARPIARRPSAVDEPTGPAWMLVLRTFTGEGSESAAAAMASQLPRFDPRLAATRVHTTPRGSMLVFGRYSGPDDPRVPSDRDWVKSLALNGQLLFPRVMLSRINLGGPTSQFALRSVRQQYPNVDPLYTLEIGVWGVFDGNLSLEEVQRKAEAQVQKLRTQGELAFVHHDFDREMSMITVGLFDSRAINAQSGLLSDEVEEAMRRYPTYSVNGEPLLEPIDPRRPSLGTQAKKPVLVEVPR